VRADQFGTWLTEQPNRTRGEFALVLHPTPAGAASGVDEGLRVLHLLLPELPLKTAVKLSADITGASRNALYDAALALKKHH
jgi:16S rRNA (cytidine1402-2'-O)-methyltransferase